jgi:hypothetical protein
MRLLSVWGVMERIEQVIQIQRRYGEPFNVMRRTANVETVYHDRAVIAPQHTLKLPLGERIILVSLEVSDIVMVKLSENGFDFPVYGFTVLNTLPSNPYNFVSIKNPNNEGVDVVYFAAGVRK